MRQFNTLSDKIFIEIFYLKYLYLQIPLHKFSKDAFSVWLCVENWGAVAPLAPPVAWALTTLSSEPDAALTFSWIKQHLVAFLYL